MTFNDGANCFSVERKVSGPGGNLHRRAFFREWLSAFFIGPAIRREASRLSRRGSDCAR